MASLVKATTDIEESLKSQNHSIQFLCSNTTNNGLPHGLGLLTTVASLPPKYRSRYLNITTKSESPLDLSVKPISPEIANDVPIAASFTEIYTEPFSDSDTDVELNTANVRDNNSGQVITVLEPVQAIHSPMQSSITTIDDINKPTLTTFDTTKSPMTPPPTPTKRKLSEKNSNHETKDDESIKLEPKDNYKNPTKMAKTDEHPTTKRDNTPVKPIKSTDTAPKTVKSQPPATKPTKNKATRKLKFDEETSSPVSGTIIRPLEDITDGLVQYSNGDIDPKYNIVEITDETKAELAAIKNVIGDYVCKLCRLKFDDAFGLAQHRCACIVLLEYRCPECGKQFNCPANLASHRRWHKPKKVAIGNAASASVKKENRHTNASSSGIRQAATEQQRRIDVLPLSNNGTTTYACEECGKAFKRQAYLRRHQLTHANDGSASGGAGGGAGGDGVANKSRSKVCETKTVSITSERVAAMETTEMALITNTTSNPLKYPQYRGASLSSSSASASASSSSSSSSSSLHSYSGSTVHEDEVSVTYMVNGNSSSTNVAYDYDIDSMSDDCSNGSTGYGRLQIVESGLTEEENIAAAALTNLRNCASVIQHTTLAH